MSPKKQNRKFKKEYALELIRIAEGDLDSARILAAGKPKRPENIFYMAEQCIEKSLKAVICAYGTPIPMTHSLAALIERLKDHCSVPFDDDLEELTEFATSRRYEEGKVLLEKEERDSVLNIAQEILNWAAAEAKKQI